MKQYCSLIVALNIILTLVGWVFLENNLVAQGQPSASERDHDAPQFSTNPPPVGFATRWDYVKSFTSEKDILNAARAGLINKDESILAMGRLGNTASVDTYGKVVDQNGQTIAGVKVRGSVTVGIGDHEEHYTETDAQGQFHFLGLHGQGLIMSFQKQGYDSGRGLLPERPDNYLPDPNNPLVFTMWKLRRAEPMIHDRKSYGINPDGRIFTIDLVDQKKTEGTNTTGDLLVQIQRPGKIKRGEKFNWSFTMTAIGGGVIEATNVAFLNEAPEAGYQPSYKINMAATDPNWQMLIEKTFYLKSRDGQAYGYFHITVVPKHQNISAFNIESHINPSTSRNLEYDP